MLHGVIMAKNTTETVSATIEKDGNNIKGTISITGKYVGLPVGVALGIALIITAIKKEWHKIPGNVIKRIAGRKGKS